jgi:hypothetical protein
MYANIIFISIIEITHPFNFTSRSSPIKFTSRYISVIHFFLLCTVHSNKKDWKVRVNWTISSKIYTGEDPVSNFTVVCCGTSMFDWIIVNYYVLEFEPTSASITNKRNITIIIRFIVCDFRHNYINYFTIKKKFNHFNFETPTYGSIGI